MAELRPKRTVFLIDDNETILDVLGQILEKRDYHVLTARSAREAEEVWRLNRLTINAVVSDKWLSEKENSTAILKLFQQDSPDVPIILMTGYPLQDQEERSRVCEGINYLPKPFSPSDLFQALDFLIGK
ncbi:MAG: two component, sigma54 specific, transcriptional regulator, Fis family [Verrucomicrobiales bacterium]|jgi:DNA-binding NtrC family response regulator|nr:two component, sigma54 specific, transcriptional regulator, Fis family [Verrucomicrobiales bacterium]